MVLRRDCGHGRYLRGLASFADVRVEVEVSGPECPDGLPLRGLGVSMPNRETGALSVSSAEDCPVVLRLADQLLVNAAAIFSTSSGPRSGLLGQRFFDKVFASI